MSMRALRRSRKGCRRETAGERLERDAQAKRQRRSPRSKVERDGIPSDGAQREKAYSDAGKGQYKHIMDDIGYSVKKSRSTNQWYVSIHGKKWTGYKWLWVNDGHTTKEGTWVEGNHFVDKAEAASSGEVDKIIDGYLKEAIGDK